MIIRMATTFDIPQITLMKKREDYPKYLKRIQQTLESKASYLVIEEDGQILGNVFLKYYGTTNDPDFPNIEDLFIREDRRDQSLGTTLIRECEKLAKTRGFCQIGLSVNPHLNPRAHSLYKKLGFKDINRPAHLSAIHDGVQDWCIDMVKDI